MKQGVIEANRPFGWWRQGACSNTNPEQSWIQLNMSIQVHWSEGLLVSSEVYYVKRLLMRSDPCLVSHSLEQKPRYVLMQISWLPLQVANFKFQRILLTKKRDEIDAQKVWIRYFGVLHVHHQQGRFKEKLSLVHYTTTSPYICPVDGVAHWNIGFRLFVHQFRLAFLANKILWNFRMRVKNYRSFTLLNSKFNEFQIHDQLQSHGMSQALLAPFA